MLSMSKNKAKLNFYAIINGERFPELLFHHIEDLNLNKNYSQDSIELV